MMKHSPRDETHEKIKTSDFDTRKKKQKQKQTKKKQNTPTKNIFYLLELFCL